MENELQVIREQEIEAMLNRTERTESFAGQRCGNAVRSRNEAGE
jgi:hypothetical protein